MDEIVQNQSRSLGNLPAPVYDMRVGLRACTLTLILLSFFLDLRISTFVTLLSLLSAIFQKILGSCGRHQDVHAVVSFGG
uniref:Uncharacterized protein n=1 Tax=Aegilops tauschii subsp. strangulata TaxID=200361 RepID=A0A453M1Q6_AEGTS